MWEGRGSRGYAFIGPLLRPLLRHHAVLRLQTAADALNDVAPMANRINGSLPPVLIAQGTPYETNAYQLNQGKRLYDWFNCKGCHANGGGAAGL